MDAHDYWTKGVELHDVGTHPGDDGHLRPINAEDVTQCGTCLRKWCHVCNPTPASRCPFEYDHEEDEEPATDSQRLSHALLKVTHWIATLEANRDHMRDDIARRALSARADDLKAVRDILNGSDDDYIRAVGGMR